jgi:predicted XRE-type DNA-binding protein
MRKRRTIKSSGNVFLDLGFSPEEAVVLAMRADLMARMRLHIERQGWTQGEAATALGISQSRVSDLVRGKWSKFSVDTLLTLAAKAGLHPRLNLVAVRSASMHALSIDT